MSELVVTSRAGGVLVVSINNPPVNALSPGVPEAIVAAIRSAAADEEIHATVVIGEGKTFISGADIKMFPAIACGDAPPLNLGALLDEIENSPKPVIMAIHGHALGGGLETAMAGHYRLAARSAKVGQPEVKLGLIPGAGGTQRLPRLAGVEKALEMCVFGEPISATDAHQLGIVDRLVDGDLLAVSIAFANTHPPVRRTRDLTAKLVDEARAASLASSIKEASRKRLRGQNAPLAAAEAVAASARLSFEDGLAYERKLFEECLRGSQASALIHVFFSEREVARIPGLPKDLAPLPVRRAAVVGAGTMGGGIAMCYANAGIPVLLKEANASALDRGMTAIRRNYETSVSRGKLTRADMDQRLELITPVMTYDGFEEADIVIEAVFEDFELKKKIFGEVDAYAREGAILASNTSTLDIDEIAAATHRPEWVVGHHFFSPANVMRLLEIVRGKATSPRVLAASFEIAKKLRKTGVLAGNCFGFIGNRMFGPYRTQAVQLVEEGATPQQVDSVLVEWGMAMGPLAVGDLAGTDVSWRIRQEAIKSGSTHVPPRTFEDVLYEKGRYGQKTRKGWYKYDENRQASPDPDVDRLLREYASNQGIQRRKISDAEIIERTIYALINEGARLLEEGIALRASDIDIVYIHGYGFPAWRGGPMKFAQLNGLEKSLSAIRRYYDQFGPAWKPATLLEKAAAEGKWG